MIFTRLRLSRRLRACDPARLVRAWLEYELPARLSIVVHYSLVGGRDIGTLLRQRLERHAT